MKKLFSLLLLSIALLFVSCDNDETIETIVSIQGLKVSKTEVFKGETIQIAFLTGERHNVPLKVTFLVDELQVGTTDKSPYVIDYSIPEDMASGLHMVSVEYTGVKKGADMSGSIKNGAFFSVENKQ